MRFSATPSYHLTKLPSAAARRLVAGLQTQLRRSEARFAKARIGLARQKEFIDTLPVGIHTLDKVGRITFVNATEAKMLGYTKHEMLGRFFWEFIPTSQQEEAKNRFSKKILGDAVETITHRKYTCKDGSEIFVRSIDKIERKATGEISVTTVFINITEAKEVESRRALQAKIEALGRMSSGIAHNFNNLMAIIQGAGELLEMLLPQTPVSTRWLNKIKEACQRGTRITQANLFYVQKEIAPRISIVDPNPIIETALEEVKTELGESDIIFELDLTAAVNIEADPTQIARIIKNLCQNSISALMPEYGTPELASDRQKTIRISCRMEDVGFRQKTVTHKHLSPGTYFVISVTDNGRGIPNEHRERIFDPFWTTEMAGKPGLGLSEVLGIAESRGGGVILSRVSNGSKIKVYFPAISYSE